MSGKPHWLLRRCEATDLVGLLAGDIVAALESLHGMRDDDERAHSAEDRLRGNVLRAIAMGNTDAPRLAAEVLLSSSISFSRWCA